MICRKWLIISLVKIKVKIFFIQDVLKVLLGFKGIAGRYKGVSETNANSTCISSE